MVAGSPTGGSWFGNRRRFLQVGLGGMALGGLAVGCQSLRPQVQRQAIQIPPLPSDLPTGGASISPMQALREFNYGKVKQEKGRTIREFEITLGTTPLQLNSAVSFVGWTYNGRIPGPTLRARAGDRVRVLFLNKGGHAHTMHFHGIHAAAMDGIRPVRDGTAFIYEFDAEPYGLHLYHCHISPVTRHIGRGLYGAFIVDPPDDRPPADELVLVMGGYDINEDKRNELYAFNGLPNYYLQHPIALYQNQLTRLYLLNLIEWEAALTFHIHANFFRVYPTGMTLTPSHESDVITMGTAERHILEFAYPLTGEFMFHPHQDQIAEAGCMGMFHILPRG